MFIEAMRQVRLGLTQMQSLAEQPSLSAKPIAFLPLVLACLVCCTPIRGESPKLYASHGSEITLESLGGRPIAFGGGSMAFGTKDGRLFVSDLEMNYWDEVSFPVPGRTGGLLSNQRDLRCLVTSWPSGGVICASPSLADDSVYLVTRATVGWDCKRVASCVYPTAIAVTEELDVFIGTLNGKLVRAWRSRDSWESAVLDTGLVEDIAALAAHGSGAIAVATRSCEFAVRRDQSSWWSLPFKEADGGGLPVAWRQGTPYRLVFWGSQLLCGIRGGENGATVVSLQIEDQGGASRLNSLAGKYIYDFDVDGERAGFVVHGGVVFIARQGGNHAVNFESDGQMACFQGLNVAGGISMHDGQSVLFDGRFDLISISSEGELFASILLASNDALPVKIRHVLGNSDVLGVLGLSGNFICQWSPSSRRWLRLARIDCDAIGAKFIGGQSVVVWGGASGVRIGSGNAGHWSWSEELLGTIVRDVCVADEKLYVCGHRPSSSGGRFQYYTVSGMMRVVGDGVGVVWGKSRNGEKWQLEHSEVGCAVEKFLGTSDNATAFVDSCGRIGQLGGGTLDFECPPGLDLSACSGLLDGLGRSVVASASPTEPALYLRERDDSAWSLLDDTACWVVLHLAKDGDCLLLRAQPWPWVAGGTDMSLVLLEQGTSAWCTVLSGIQQADPVVGGCYVVMEGEPFFLSWEALGLD